jgi:AraC family transcriptional regulator, transcriptional activator of pobA
MFSVLTTSCPAWTFLVKIACRRMDEISKLLYNSNMRTVASPRSIQTHNLFGEAGDLPDVVHCETIAARSVLHDWTFPPHRHARLHQILQIERGGGEATLEGRRFALRPMRVINVPVGHVHGFAFKPGTQGFVLTISAEMLDEVLEAREGLLRILAQPTVLKGTKPMRATMTQIFDEYAGRHFARAHMLRALAANLIGLVARELASDNVARDGTATSDLVRRFEALIEQHFRKHWTVSDYAAALSITPTHLSRLTRAATGHAASQLILERVVREARRNLVYTNMPISTIAYALGFNDPAYFSRLFVGATGLSPRSFRDKAQAAG